ncbi:TPA: hypothetical protein HA265_02605 [Candidatus Woesearchaeota archaeon]|nr:hypothetical protein [Candidatus Woesearchaeota archaeon]
MPKLNKISKLFETRFREIIATGLVFATISVYLYQRHYRYSGDDVTGLIAASALFLSIIMIGQAIRGWRDVAQWQGRFVTMRTKKGDHLSIKKRVKKSWR